MDSRDRRSHAMGRLSSELLERVESFSHRVVDVSEVIEKQRRARRVIDQLVGCGTSVGANAWEADEAMSRPDFCRVLGIVIKEIVETRYWLRFVGKRGWVNPERLSLLDREALELKRIFGAMLTRTRKRTRQ
jgi:four helix bundle protein